MKHASKYLQQHKHSDKGSVKPNPGEVKDNEELKDLTIDYLIEKGVDVNRPKKRHQCPTKRPCPFVSCKYHLYIDVNRTGSIKYNFIDIEPHEMKNSCALDIAEEGPTKTKEVATYLNLTPERVRQIERKALNKLQDTDIGEQYDETF